MKAEIRSSILVPDSNKKYFSYLVSLNPAVVISKIWFAPRADEAVYKKSQEKQKFGSRIYFTDGSTAFCQLYSYASQKSFSMQVGEFSSWRLALLDGMRCHYNFLYTGSGQKKITCSFEFKFSSNFWNLFFKVFFKKVMQQKIDEILRMAVT